MKTSIYIITQETPVVSFRQGQPEATGLTLSASDLVEVDPEYKMAVAGVSYYRLTPTYSSSMDWWIAGGSHNLQVVEIACPVTNLQPMYVDNFPHGVFLLSQPIDRPEFIQSTASEALPPFEKIFVHYWVVHPRTGVTFYFAQHQTFDQSVRVGWLPERRRRLPTEEDPHDDATLLLQPELVSVGRFAFLVRQNVDLRLLPDVGQTSRTGRYALCGDVVVASVIRHSPYKYGNGPFLLLDNQFWLCQQRHGDKAPVVVPLEIEEGLWTLQVRATSALGLPVMRQPCRQFILSPDSNESNNNPPMAQVDSIGSISAMRILQRNELVVCDARFESPNSGVWFYHVVGDSSQTRYSDSVGWILDRTVTGDRKRVLLVQVCTDPVVAKATTSGASLRSGTNSYSKESQSSELTEPLPDRNAFNPDKNDGWTAEYVRDVAVAGAGDGDSNMNLVQESGREPDRDVIVFERHMPAGEPTLLVHVHCKTQDVIIERLDTHERTMISCCTAPQLAKILQDPTTALRFHQLLRPPQSLKSRSVSSDYEGAHATDGLIQSFHVSSDGNESPISCASSALPPPISACYPALALVESPPEEQIRQLNTEECPRQLHPSGGGSLENTADLQTLDPQVPSPLHPKANNIALLSAHASSTSWANESDAKSSLILHTRLLPPPPSSTVCVLPKSQPSYRVVWEDEVSQDGHSNVPANSSDPNETDLARLTALSTSPSGRASDGLILYHRRKELVKDDDAIENSSVGEQLNRRCGVCNDVFESARARSLHCLKMHNKFSCNYCMAVFSYNSDLKRHRDERDHW